MTIEDYAMNHVGLAPLQVLLCPRLHLGYLSSVLWHGAQGAIALSRLLRLRVRWLCIGVSQPETYPCTCRWLVMRACWAALPCLES